MSEGKVTLTCGHSAETSVGVWEPDIDRHSHRCRSYSAYCPACAEEATLAMVDYIEELEAKVELLRAALEPFADEALWWSERGDLSLRTPEDGFEDLANTATGVDPTLHAANVLAQTSAKEGEE